MDTSLLGLAHHLSFQSTSLELRRNISQEGPAWNFTFQLPSDPQCPIHHRISALPLGSSSFPSCQSRHYRLQGAPVPTSHCALLYANTRALEAPNVNPTDLSHNSCIASLVRTKPTILAPHTTLPTVLTPHPLT